jgi:hypothetical protein
VTTSCHRWLVALVGCSLAIGYGMLPSFGRAGVKDPSTIQCPSPPAGWSRPPVSKSVSTPENTNPGYGGNYEQVGAGGNNATVNCVYHDTSAKQVNVILSFALPTDLNPFNDFFFGCSKGDVGWNNTGRVYRIASADQWAIATLMDPSRYMSPGDVPKFEAIARRLLQNGNGYGHSCSLVLRPTQILSRYFFDIRVGGTNLSASFWTPSSPEKGNLYVITKVTPATAAMSVDTSSGTRVLAVKLTHGIDYRLATARTPLQARFGIRLTSSTVAGCGRGATGTLAIAAPLSVTITACGRVFTPLVESFVRVQAY